jgi:ankyrin repeat protein
MPGPLLDVEACQKLIIQNKAAELDAILKKVKPGEIAKPFYQGSEYFAIRYAAESGSADCIKVLLAHGASPNMSVEGDYWPYICTPPLFTAAEKGHPEAVQMLLDGGANPFHKVNGRSAKTMAKGKECTALLKAAEARAKAATAA